MKRFSIIVLIFICLVSLGISNALAEPILYDWAFNIDNDFYFAPDFYTGPDPGQLPSYLDDSGFDWDTGLGTIKISYSPGIAGSYHILSFFDHEIDEGLNIYFNETGASHGSLASGQSWEIDEPGWGTPDEFSPYYIGDIYPNVRDYASLDNSYFYDGFTGDYLSFYEDPIIDDVSMAMGWNFDLSPLEVATINIILQETMPDSGFYLSHTDSDSSYTFYFSSTLDINPIPEPGTLILLCCGLLGFLGIKKREMS